MKRTWLPRRAGTPIATTDPNVREIAGPGLSARFLLRVSIGTRLVAKRDAEFHAGLLPSLRGRR